MSKFQELSDNQSKLILERIHNSEKNIHSIESSLEGIVRKESKFCTKIDEFATNLKRISDNETYDDSLEKLFEVISCTTVHLADIESSKISRIEDKLLHDLMQFEMICKSTRDDVKNLGALRDFELNKRSQINVHKKTRKNVLVENEVMLSNIQLSKILKELSATAEKFENQKFMNMKEIMLNFILIQMKYFASGIEILSTAYQNVSNMDESSHSEKFKEELKKINKQFKRNIEQDNWQGNRFSFMRAALSKFSHSTSNVDSIGRHDFLKNDAGKSQSSMSLNFLDNDIDDILEKHKKPIESLKNEDISDSDESDIDDSSNMTQTDTENIQQKR